ncbi:AraC family transcriptional regulator [Planococcus maritimus]|uniref:AraC family transcriptional regulator n=3 Tax=Planococcus TaxID=1372 RepID=A0A0U2N4T8_9BACL|nr:MULTISPECIES: helix-turn-helix domain-containing protein [Planococcus]MDN5710400.1 AraC family transcriptional regulator [Planococcus sp. (in: firmicutes)]ALS75097.1 AraC family transcriptional regulator [Planococcus rifietoensis]ANU16179.1 AraC family transcriptional regulator [Planococcus maritimus]AUD12953.1 AraC family transcriptional regulator [Planococcus sp. MB-3u-03]MDE0583670.1 AraC family transcriptional regulator [Planococcus sp. A6]
MNILETPSIQETISRIFMNETENVAQLEGLERFFEVETQLMHEIHNLEKDRAKETLRELIDMLALHAGKDIIRTVRNYYIILSSVMARKLYEMRVPPKKAFAFNAACVELVDKHMNDSEFMYVADELIEFFTSIISERKQPSFGHQTVNKVVIFINDEVERDLSVEEIAKHFNISTSHLSRIFREHAGITLVEYLNVRRVEESQYYLRHSNKGISEISKQFHFCNQSYFTRIFKKYTSVTPKQFRDSQHIPYFRYTLPNAK